MKTTSEGLLALVYQLKKKCQDLDNQLMEEFEFSASELQFFLALDQCQGLTSLELAQSMSLSSSRVSRIVDKLVNRGYLNRDIDAQDRRAITLSLTNSGKEIKIQIDKRRNSCEQRLLNGLPPKELCQLQDLLERLIKEL